MNNISTEGRSIEYRVRRSERAKRIRIAVYLNGDVIVTVPRGVHNRAVQKFVNLKSDWVAKKVEGMSRIGGEMVQDFAGDEFDKYKHVALAFVRQKVEEWNEGLQLSVNDIKVKNHKTKWGSCSAKRNLNFNYRILFLPKELQDYIIVHELCHLIEMNHSDRFWRLVERELPNYKEIKKQLCL